MEGDEAIKCHHICRKNEPAAPWVKTIFKLRDRKSSCTVQVSAGVSYVVVVSPEGLTTQLSILISTTVSVQLNVLLWSEIKPECLITKEILLTLS